MPLVAEAHPTLWSKAKSPDTTSSLAVDERYYAFMVEACLNGEVIACKYVWHSLGEKR